MLGEELGVPREDVTARVQRLLVERRGADGGAASIRDDASAAILSLSPSGGRGSG